MRKQTRLTPERAEQIQDAIFRRMNADQKLEVGAKLWLLGKALNPKHFEYGRSARVARKDR